MAVLKKVKASTLMETLVATVLIVIVFMLASMVLNSLFANSIAQNDSAVRQELMQLQYQYQNSTLELPYYDEFNQWTIEVTEVDWESATQTIFSAVHQQSNKEVVFRTANGRD